MSKQSNQRYRKEKEKELMNKSNNNDNIANSNNNLQGQDKLSGHEFDTSSNSTDKENTN